MVAKMCNLDNIIASCKISKLCSISSVLDSSVQYIRNMNIADLPDEITDAFYEFLIAHEKFQSVLLNEQANSFKKFTE